MDTSSKEYELVGRVEEAEKKVEPMKLEGITEPDPYGPFANFVCLWFVRFQYLVFTLAVMASILVICHAIVEHYCVLQFNAAALFIILIAALTLLGYVEALHYSNVSVEKWDMTHLQERFPRACKVQKLVNTNEKVQRFLVGRQFFVIFVVFIIAEITTLPELPTDYLGMPENVVKGLVGSGLPGIMLVLTIGQLVPQLFVEEFTIPFLNLYGCYMVTQLCFFAEWIGVCNFSWLLFNVSDYLFFGAEKEAHVTASLQQPGQSTVPHAHAQPAELSVDFMKNEEEALAEASTCRTGCFDICKYIWSTAFTLFALVVVVYGISQHYSILPAPIPVLYILFFGMLTLLFYLEGLMICIVATQYWNPEDFKTTHPRAYQLHVIVNAPDTVKKFIVGRQFFTLVTNFVLAQVCVFPHWPSDGYDPVLFFILIRSGLVGVMIILAFAQLLPELLAARHPLAFMNFYGSTAIVQLSLFIDSIGVGHCAWFLFFATRGLCCAKFTEEEVHNKPAVGQRAHNEPEHHRHSPQENCHDVSVTADAVVVNENMDNV
jgi:hypothetical protein